MWPQCLVWHWWLPGLSPCSFGTLRAVAAGDLAGHNQETSLGAYPVHAESVWCPEWDPQDAQNMTEDVPDHLNIWFDGSVEPI